MRRHKITLVVLVFATEYHGSTLPQNLATALTVLCRDYANTLNENFGLRLIVGSRIFGLGTRIGLPLCGGTIHFPKCRTDPNIEGPS